MKRFDYINTCGTVGYTPAEIAAMSDPELAAAIREEPDWNPTKYEFVRDLFDDAREHPEPLDLETAQQDLDNFHAEGWHVPADLTAEEYREIWNKLCREYES